MSTTIQFHSKVFIIPGLGNSLEGHWQTLWEKKYSFKRISQAEWGAPRRDEWIQTIEKSLVDHELANVILVGHSLGCSAIAFWAEAYKHKIKGALLVAPSDTEAESYPPGTTGFKPMPLFRINFPTTVVASENDFYVSKQRAKYFADAWGSRLVSIGDAGHINVASGFGEWSDGLEILKSLDV